MFKHTPIAYQHLICTASVSCAQLVYLYAFFCFGHRNEKKNIQNDKNE